MPHGDVAVLNQPLEVLIILGGAMGGFIIANPKPVLGAVVKTLGRLLKGPPQNKKPYLELLTLQYAIFRLAKSKGMLTLETYIENPEESALFGEYPKFLKKKAAVTFLCDYLRLMTMGTDNPHEVETLLEEDIEAMHEGPIQASDAIQAMADGLPAFGIVAAVLGIISTMGSITDPPEVLGEKIGAALVGTFLGILMAYGLVGPMASNLKGYADIKYFNCIKAGLLAHMQGYAPAVSVEFSRKILMPHERPSFLELEEALEDAPSA